MGIIDRLRGLGGRSRRQGPFSPDGPLLAERLPAHVAIIMDGNGRWAKRRGLPAMAGHREGARALKRTVEAAIQMGIRQLTVYSFSTENWSRPAEEVRGLMDLMGEMLERELPELHAQGVRITFVGSRDGVDSQLAERFDDAQATTAHNTVLDLFVAFNYGGRQEIVDAVKRAALSGLVPEQIDEDVIAANLYAPHMSEPDLIIRTSGELRLSNFLLWESAYSELYFTPLLWPDFDAAEFSRAIADYAARDRRFGGRRTEELA
ncbi:MAG: polyprenyl diphosphate synthase [Thermoleophilia bacterium]